MVAAGTVTIDQPAPRAAGKAAAARTGAVTGAVTII
jgi:hypothetical protein